MNLDRARALKERIRGRLPLHLARRSSGEPVVVAVGVATTQQHGDFRIAVRAQREEDLTIGARRFLEGMTEGALDVRITGPITPQSTPLLIGASTAHARGCWGTLGFFARRNSDGSRGFVSNNHVIAHEDQGREGDDVIHADGSHGTRVVIGSLAGDYPRLNGEARRVDCAFARLRPDVAVKQDALGEEDRLSAIPASPTGPVEVIKIGGTTGRTEGRMTAFTLTDVIVDYSFGPVQFHDQIEIESLTTTPFSRGGDSGSLIFTRDREPLALLFAGSALGGTTDSGLTYANPIGSVLEALGVTLVT
jgi:hypothetical protein